MAEQRKIDFPFEEVYLKNGLYLRTFAEDTDSEELIWHRDKENRKILIVEGNGWLLQVEDQLPMILEKNKEYSIKANQWHRVIKGKNDLILFIKKENKK